MDLSAAVLPVVFVTLALGFVSLILHLALRAQGHQRELLSAERLAAIDKGQQLPPETFLNGDARGRRRSGNALRTGLLVLASGLGLIAALLVLAPDKGFWGWGLLPLLVGLAHLAYWFAHGRGEWQATSALEVERQRRWLSQSRKGDAAADGAADASPM